MEQRFTIVTLGVAEVAAARRFYERMGWRADLEVEETVFFRVGGMFLILWSRQKLAEDSGVADGMGWGGVTLAHNVGSTDEVDAVIEQAREAGARISVEPRDTLLRGLRRRLRRPRWTSVGDRVQSGPRARRRWHDRIPIHVG